MGRGKMETIEMGCVDMAVELSSGSVNIADNLYYNLS